MNHSRAASLLLLVAAGCSGDPDPGQPTTTPATKNFPTAGEVSYNRATSALVATNVQAAVDEVEHRLDTVEARAPIPGPQGPAGAAGPAGPAGTSGTNGTNGTNGTDGIDGVDGADGADGQDGTPGDRGFPGDPGQPVTSAIVPVGDATCPHGGSRFMSASGLTYACNGAPSSVRIGHVWDELHVPSSGIHRLITDVRFEATHDGSCILTAHVVTQASTGGYTMMWPTAHDRTTAAFSDSFPREWMRPGTDPTASFSGQNTGVFQVTAGHDYSFGCGVELTDDSGMIGRDLYCDVRYVCN